MKTNNLTASHFITTMLLVSFVPSVSASHAYYITPGRSDGGLKIGMSRSSILKTLGKPPKTFHFSWNVTDHNKSSRVSIVEDEWDRENGQTIEVTDILYVNGKIIQIQDSSENANLENGIYNGDSLGDVIAKYKGLKLSTYYYPIELGWGDGYFYDDERQGVAFYFFTQDPSAEPKIDSIIIHRSGFAIIPPSLGVKPKSVKADRELTLPVLYSHMR